MTDRLSRLRCREIITPVTTALIFAGCAASGVLDVSWVAPTTNVDGSPLTDVVSYRVYYSSTTDPPCPTGSAIGAAAPKVPLPPDQRLVVRLTGLTVGKLYFVAVTAVNSRGSESSCTSTVSGRARQP
jgi:Fibronectin type III domain